MLEGVEGDNPDRVVELSGDEVGDDGFEVRPLDLDFAATTPPPAKAVDDQVSGLIRPVGYGPAISRHAQSPTQRNDDAAIRDLFQPPEPIFGAGRFGRPLAPRPSSRSRGRMPA